MSEALSDYLAMGGYGGFIWSAYGISLAVLGGLVVNGFMKLNRLERALVRTMAQNDHKRPESRPQ